MATVEDRLMSPDEAAEYLGVSLSTLSNWRVQRSGPSFTKAGRLVRYRESALVSYVAARNVGTSDQPLATKGGLRS